MTTKSMTYKDGTFQLYCIFGLGNKIDIYHNAQWNRQLCSSLRTYVGTYRCFIFS